MRVIFMGTPSFAVPALLALIEHPQFEVIAVYTKEPKVAGRGMKVIKSEVHSCAEAHAIQVLTPKTLKSQEAVEELKKLGADVIVVAAYGLILTEPVLNAAKHGCINIHPSDLPRWRGAAPVQRTIMSGDKATALCIMRMDQGVDTGDVILRIPVQLDNEINAGDLGNLMANLGAQKLIEALTLIRDNKASVVKQSDQGLTYADKIKKEEEIIDWNRSAFEIACQVRALSPKPGACFKYHGEVIKLIKASYLEENSGAIPGTILDHNFSIACGSGIIVPQVMQREGKKALAIEDLLRGFQVKVGSVLG